MPPPSKTSIATIAGYFDPLDPRAADISMEAIAHALARITRFNGHHHAPNGRADPLRVAPHSMRVARIGWHLYDSMRPIVDAPDWHRDKIEAVLALLLHDAPEGYTGDRLRPCKTDADRLAETLILRAIVTRLGFVGPIGDRVIGWVDSDLCWVADNVALAQEALIFQPGAEDWTPGIPGVTPDLIASTLHLFWPRPRECWISSVRVAGNAAATPDPTADGRALRGVLGIDW